MFLLIPSFRLHEVLMMSGPEGAAIPAIMVATRLNSPGILGAGSFGGEGSLDASLKE